MDTRAPEQEAREQVHPLCLGHRGGERGEVLSHGAPGVQQVQPLGQVRDTPLSAPDHAAFRFDLPVEDPQEGGLAGAVAPVSAIRSGPRIVSWTPPRRTRPAGRTGPEALRRRRACGRAGPWSREVPVRSSARHAGPGRPRPAGPWLPRPGRRASHWTCRPFLGAALHGPGHDLRKTGVPDVAGRGAGAPGRPLPGLLHLPFLTLDCLLGLADVLLGTSRATARACV